jgi:hypothetical protein
MNLFKKSCFFIVTVLALSMSLHCMDTENDNGEKKHLLSSTSSSSSSYAPNVMVSVSSPPASSHSSHSSGSFHVYDTYIPQPLADYSFDVSAPHASSYTNSSVSSSSSSTTIPNDVSSHNSQRPQRYSDNDDLQLIFETIAKFIDEDGRLFCENRRDTVEGLKKLQSDLDVLVDTCRKMDAQESNLQARCQQTMQFLNNLRNELARWENDRNNIRGQIQVLHSEGKSVSFGLSELRKRSDFVCSTIQQQIQQQKSILEHDQGAITYAAKRHELAAWEVDKLSKHLEICEALRDRHQQTLNTVNAAWRRIRQNLCGGTKQKVSNEKYYAGKKKLYEEMVKGVRLLCKTNDPKIFSNFGYFLYLFPSKTLRMVCRYVWIEMRNGDMPIDELISDQIDRINLTTLYKAVRVMRETATACSLDAMENGVRTSLGTILKVIEPLAGVPIKKLSLSSDLLHALPPSIVYLQNLEELDLSNNILRSLPDELSLLKNLKRINLSNNAFESRQFDCINALPTSLLNLVALGSLIVDWDVISITPSVTAVGNNKVSIKPSRIIIDLNKREIHWFYRDKKFIRPIYALDFIHKNTSSSSSSSSSSSTDPVLKPSIIEIDLSRPDEPTTDDCDTVQIDSFEIPANRAATSKRLDRIFIKPSVVYKSNSKIAFINPYKITVNVNVGKNKTALVVVDLSINITDGCMKVALGKDSDRAFALKRVETKKQ